jgi:hypothetical protein
MERWKSPATNHCFFNPHSSGSNEQLRCQFESRAWLMLQHEVKHEQGRNKEKHCQG